MKIELAGAAILVLIVFCSQRSHSRMRQEGRIS